MLIISPAMQRRSALSCPDAVHAHPCLGWLENGSAVAAACTRPAAMLLPLAGSCMSLPPHCSGYLVPLRSNAVLLHHQHSCMPTTQCWWSMLATHPHPHPHRRIPQTPMHLHLCYAAGTAHHPPSQVLPSACWHAVSRKAFQYLQALMRGCACRSRSPPRQPAALQTAPR